MTFTEKLEKLTACGPAVRWAKNYPTLEDAWAKCERGDWLLWLAGRVVKKDAPEHKAVVMAACQCARLALPHVPTGERRPLTAIETAERWCRGEATLTEVMKAAYAANYAVNAAANAAYYAADSAANAAYYAANYAVNAAVNAAAIAAYYAADSDAIAAYYAANAASDVLRTCAEIVREHVACPTLR